MGNVGELFAVVHLGFEVAEEVLHDRVVIAVAFGRHRLGGLVGMEQYAMRRTASGSLDSYALPGADRVVVWPAPHASFVR